MMSIKGRIAIVGIGETKWYKRGQAPEAEFKLCIEAIRAAAADAGVDPREITGFSSYSEDRNTPARLANALGVKDFAMSVMQWGGGGGGCCGAVANAAAGILAGYCDYAVVYRGLAQGQFGRFGQGAALNVIPGDMGYVMPYGMMSPAQLFVMRITRFMHEHGVNQSALRAVAMASYHHAQSNPRAIMHGKPLTEAAYDASRWITEPLHLYDCCQENDGAAALLLTTTERAAKLAQKPAVILAAASGGDPRAGEFGASACNAPDYPTSNFKYVARRAFATAGLGPQDVDVLQCYENFTGGVVMSMVEHGFCQPEEANDFFTLDNFKAPTGRLPLNTSGGNLAEVYMHGLSLITEAVRQLRGTSPNQVPDARVSMVIGGPMVNPVSNLILGTA
jgi:acetyl-CoA acetyltransferase